MSAEKIISGWKKGQFKPVYWLEGEENYPIDKVVDFAEHRLLPEGESAFNLSIFYGRDSNWADVVNACRRYPMFAERQVVILKEAQQMRELDKLEAYIEQPLASTILVVAHKEKKVDGRSKLAKLLKDKAEVLTTKKMYENQLPDWTANLVAEKGLTIGPRALALLVDHIGNDLSRIENEIEKITVNLQGRTSISEDDIERFVGISKEYNVFELQEAIARKDVAKSIRIVQYFAGNPKAGSIHMVLPSLYSFFSKVYMVSGVGGGDEKSVAAAIGVNPFFAKDYLKAYRNYGAQGVERVLLLLHHYNLKSIGVNAPPTEDAELLKEMISKMVA